MLCRVSRSQFPLPLAVFSLAYELFGCAKHWYSGQNFLSGLSTYLILTFFFSSAGYLKRTAYFRWVFGKVLWCIYPPFFERWVGGGRQTGRYSWSGGGQKRKNVRLIFLFAQLLALAVRWARSMYWVMGVLTKISSLLLLRTVQ